MVVEFEVLGFFGGFELCVVWCFFLVKSLGNILMLFDFLSGDLVVEWMLLCQVVENGLCLIDYVFDLDYVVFFVMIVGSGEDGIVVVDWVFEWCELGEYLKSYVFVVFVFEIVEVVVEWVY